MCLCVNSTERHCLGFCGRALGRACLKRKKEKTQNNVYPAGSPCQRATPSALGCQLARPGPLGWALALSAAGRAAGWDRYASSRNTNKQPPPDPELKVSAGRAESSALRAGQILTSGEFLRGVSLRGLLPKVWSQHQQHLHYWELVRPVGSQAPPQTCHT